MKLSFLSIAAMLTSACSILPAGEPLDTHRLPAAARSAAQAGTLAASLRIARPASPARLAGTRIVVLPRDNVFSVYKGARWSDPAPMLLRERLLDAFAADGRVAALSSDAQGAQADYQLDSELLDFQIEYRAGVPRAVIRLDVLLLKTSTRHIVARRRFDSVVPVNGKELPEAVRALGKASDALADQVRDWGIDRIGAGT